MTLIYDKPVAGPAVHAFVIGVGAYPHAKKTSPNTHSVLQKVADIQSAANGALLFADWLIDRTAGEGYRLTLPLASIEALITAPVADKPVYKMRNAGPAIEAPTVQSVMAAGEAWLNRLNAQAGNVALFYICGHGAGAGGQDPIVFLSDLNANKNDQWGAFLNIRETATALKHLAGLSSAHFFVDACQEFIASFELSKTGIGARFTGTPDPFSAGESKVSVLCASAAATLAFEGALNDPNQPDVLAGRFTQTLLQALDGAAARDLSGSGDWAVYPNAIYEDLKPLYRLRADWRDKPFDPSLPELPNETHAIVLFKKAPQVPILVRTDPATAIGAYEFAILNATKTPPVLRDCPKGKAVEFWATWLPASNELHWIVARSGDVAGAATERSFTPFRSIFNQTIRI